MGDMKAKVGSGNCGYEECMEKGSEWGNKKNGHLFKDHCVEIGRVISNVISNQKKIHILTWTSPDQRVKNWETR